MSHLDALTQQVYAHGQDHYARLLHLDNACRKMAEFFGEAPTEKLYAARDVLLAEAQIHNTYARRRALAAELPVQKQQRVFQRLAAEKNAALSQLSLFPELTLAEYEQVLRLLMRHAVEQHLDHEIQQVQTGLQHQIIA